jgi:hypothetical protein
MPRPVAFTASGVAATPWKNADWYRDPFSLQIDTTVTGTVTYNVETTQTDYLAGVTAIVQTPVSAASTSQRTTVSIPCRAWRINITAGTGSIAVEGIQAGLS